MNRINSYNINLLPATISEDLLFCNEFVSKKYPISPKSKLDAIFIPTLGERNNINRLTKELLKYSKNVYLILSGKNDLKLESNSIKIINFTKEQHIDIMNNFNSSKNPSSKLLPNYDIPSKRNYALRYSKDRGYKYVGLIDDDIFINKEQLKKAVSLLENETVLVGFYSTYFPDKSTISLIECHLKQIPPNVSLSGNCLFFDTKKISGFFPYVYNEDWMFIMSNFTSDRSIKGAGIVEQGYHEPWLDYKRIEFEQFGDIIAYGARFARVGTNKLLPTKEEFWQEVIDKYMNRLYALKKIAIKRNEFINQLDKAIDTALQYDSCNIMDFLDTYNLDKIKHEKDYNNQ